MKLVYTATGVEVRVGDTVALGAGRELAIIHEITKPHHPASTGRVYVKMVDGASDGDYYPSVIGAEWIEREDRPTPTLALLRAAVDAKQTYWDASVKLEHAIAPGEYTDKQLDKAHGAIETLASGGSADLVSAEELKWFLDQVGVEPPC